MTVDFIKYAFVAGEISPRFHGRADLEKYDLGVAESQNVFVDYRGGINKRGGTELVDYEEGAVVYFPFSFSEELANSYGIQFGNNFIRFIQDGAYVLLSPGTVVATTPTGTATRGTFSAAVANGDWVKIGTWTFKLLNVSGSDADLYLVTGVAFTGSLPSGSYAKIYTIASPYGTADLAGLRFSQNYDEVTITSKDFAPRLLKRSAPTSWTLTTQTLTPPIATPGSLTAVGSGGGTSGVLFAVAAVDRYGQEGIASEPLLVTGIVNYTTTAGWCNISWARVANAAYYKIYRSLVINDSTRITRAASLGYIGRTAGLSFTDNNIIPDFARGPINFYDPFAGGAIDTFEVTNGGSGYAAATTISVSGGGGSGFVGFPVLSATGVIESVIVLNRGSGYSNPIVTIGSGGSGSGATFSLTVTPSTGNFPRISAKFQKRLLYASSTNNPLRLWASKPEFPKNFNNSTTVFADDSYEFDLTTSAYTPILHAVAVRSGVLLMTASEIQYMTAGFDEPVTAINADADTNSFSGTSSLVPLRVHSEILYEDHTKRTVYTLAYTDFTKLYAAKDVSILASHLFNESVMTSWGFAGVDYKLVYASREDGKFLTFTIVQDQNIFAWTKNDTVGKVKNVFSLREDRVDSVYLSVERVLNGKTVRTLERQKSPDFNSIEDAWFLDCALKLPATTPNATLTANGVTGVVTLTASGSVFSSGDVGKVFRYMSGKGRVTTYTSGTVIQVTLTQDLPISVPHSSTKFFSIPAGAWSLDAEVTSVSGLQHLEGETVTGLIDGSVYTNLVVTNGAVTLPVAASRIIIGFNYRAYIKTLPLTISGSVVEYKEKRVVGLAAQFYQSRGWKTGPTLDLLQEIKQSSISYYGEPAQAFTGYSYQILEVVWSKNGQTYIVQDNPLPMSLLGLVAQTEVGDDND